MGKVTDPALLAQLEGAPGKVTDPAVLAQLEGSDDPPGLLSRVGSAVWSAVKPGQYPIPPLASPRQPDETAAAYAARVGHEGLREMGSPAGIERSMAMVAGTMPVGGGETMSAIKDWLGQKSIEQGRKALSGIGTPLTARRLIPEAAVQQALDTGAIRPFGTVTGTAGRLETAADTIGAEYGDILKRLDAAGVTGPDALKLATELSQKAQVAKATSLGSARPGLLESAADELLTKPATGTELGLMQAEEIKRGLQAEARREYDKISRQYTTAGETKKELASDMRAAIEDAVQAQAAKAPTEAAAFQPVKARLSNTLEALKAAEEGAARAARRKSISLSSTIVGSAAGAATGSPLLGAAGAFGHGVLDRRLSSTLAAAANRGSKTAGYLAGIKGGPGANQFAAGVPLRVGLPAFGSEEPGTGTSGSGSGAPATAPAQPSEATRARPQHSAVTTALRSNPQSLGPYAPVLQSAAQQGPDGLAARHFVLWSTSEDYRNQPAFAGTER